MSPSLTFVGPLALGLLTLWLLLRMHTPSLEQTIAAVAATVGTLCIAYGVREFLRATGGGYYCCNHEFYQGIGVGLTAVGWAILLLGLVPVLAGRLET